MQLRWREGIDDANRPCSFHCLLDSGLGCRLHAGGAHGGRTGRQCRRQCRRAGQPSDAGPQAGFSDQDEENRCKLITVARGEGAELVEEKTPEQGRDFAFLESQEGLLEDFRVDEERRKDCVLAFGLSFAGGPAAAPAVAVAGAAPGAGLAGAPIAAGSIAGSVGIGVLSAATLAALAAAVAAGSPTIPPTTTE